jgi:tetratricopeptide (TPR) repeat protein
LPRRLVIAYALFAFSTAVGSGPGPAYAQQNPEFALTLSQLENEVRMNPEDAELRRLFGLALHEGGQLARAIEQFNEAIRRTPGDVALYLGLAGVFTTAKLMEEAETLLVRTTEAFPASVAAIGELGEARFAAGKVEQAVTTFEAALQALQATEGAGPNSDLRERAFIHRRIGDMRVHLIQFDEALEAYQRARVLDENNLEVHLALGKLYLRRNRLEDALGEYGPIVASDTSNVDALEGIAEAQLRLGQFEESITAAETVIGIDPEHLGAHYLRVTALVRRGDQVAAEQALEQYRTLEAEVRARDHRDREIGGIYKAALAEMLNDNGPEAVQLLRDGIQAHPDSSELYLNLGLTLNSLDRYDEAIEVFETMLASGMGDEALVQRSLAEAEESLRTTDQ